MRIGGGQTWQIHVGIAPSETRRDDADNCVGGVVQLDRLPDYIRTGSVLPLPEKVAQDGDWRGVAAGSVGRRELTPKQRRDAHVIEHVWRIKADIYGDGKFFAGEIFAFFVLQKNVIDRGSLANLVGLAAVDHEQRSAAIFVAELDVHHAFGVFVWIGIEEDSIDDAEDRSGRANSEHQGKDGADGKPGRFAELPKREV